jgi:mono/diheme cytochrome c family protein
MREHLARWAVAASVITVILLAFLTAQVRQRDAVATSLTTTGSEATQDPAVQQRDTASIARGRAVYAQQRCASCHEIAGAGNPRYPLDGVANRRSASELMAWTVAPSALEDSLPPSAFRRKQQYAGLPAADLNALVAYLSTLRAPGAR